MLPQMNGRGQSMALSNEGLMEVPGVRSGWVQLRSGARAHYSAAGDSGPALVLLHGGIPGSSGMAGWRFMLPFLGERGFRVFAPDRPGFGLADTRPEHWPTRGWMSWVDFVEEFANALCLDEFFLAGNSNGAQCSAYYTVNHPERVPRLGLIATGGFSSSLGIDSSLLKRGMRIPPFEGTKESMKEAMSSIIYRKEAVSDQLLEMRTRSAIAQQESFAAAGAWNRRAGEDPNLKQLLNLKGRLDVLTTPTIYLFGKNDVLNPVENAYLQEHALPNIQFFYPEECGHQGQTDQPEMFNQVFLEFFRDGRVSRKTADWAGVSTRRPEIPTLVEQATAVPA
jgi:2-hydroxy-6-oxonona-2,4-dienedioate hydrolase